MKVCSLCGKQWPDNTKFCPADGTTVVDIAPRDNSIRPSLRNKENKENKENKKLEKVDHWTGLIGKVLNRTYQIEEKLGQGGMGAVFRARHLGIGDTVALKIISEEHTQDSVMLARFRREAQAVRRLAHPNAVAVYDFNSTEEGLFFMVMEFVKGQTLEQYLAEKLIVTPQRAWEILHPVAQALDIAHSLGIIHRDIKPANLMLCRDSGGKEQIKVLDFGTARLSSANEQEAVSLTQQGQIFGTPFYMAPESVLGEPITHSVDIYSLGVVLYKMLTGTLPFQSERSMQVMMAHAHTDPDLPSQRNPKLLGKYDSIILKALEKTPIKRYQIAKELVDSLFNSLNEGAILATSSAGFRVDDILSARTRTASQLEPNFNCYIGREQEIKRLQDGFSQACEGRANPMFIISSPGLGKTQLLTRFRDWANEQGAVVLLGKFFDYGGSINEPLRTFKQLLTGLVSTGLLKSMPNPFLNANPAKRDSKLLVPETTSQEKWQLFASLASTFTSLAPNRTIVMILDDIQWADALSLEFVGYLLRTTETRKFYFIGGSHLEETRSKTHPFRSWLIKQAQYIHYEKMELHPFDKKGVNTLLQAIFQCIEVSQKDVDMLYQLTGGNPLYLIEVIKLLMNSQKIVFQNSVWYGSGFDEVKLPDTVTNVVRYKLEACPEQLREVLGAAAVIGDNFSFELLQMILDINENELEELLNKAVKESLLQDDEETNKDEYQFYNTTIRQVIYDEIPKRQKRRLHSRAALAIAKLNAGKTELTSSALTYHYYSAGEWEAVLKHSSTAIEQALSKQAMDEVVRLSRYAEEALNRLSEEADTSINVTNYRRLIGQTRLKRAIALMRLGNFKEAQTEAEDVKEFIERLNAPELQAQLYLVLTELCFWTGRNTEGFNLGSRGLVLARQINDEECVRYMMFYLAWCRVRITPISESLTLFQQIVELSKQAGDISLQARSLSTLGNLLHITGQWRKGRAYIEEAHHLAKFASDPFAQCQVLLFSTWSLDFENNLSKVKDLADEGIKISHNYGWRNWEGYQYYVLGRSYLRSVEPNFELAQEMLSRSFSIMQETYDKMGQLTVSKELAKLELMTQPDPSILDKLREITSGLAKQKEMIAYCEGIIILADAEAKVGSVENAIANYRNALKISETIPFLEVQWRIHFGLAECLKKQLEETLALEHMIRAIEVINRLKQELDGPDTVAKFLENKEEVYTAYAQIFS